MVLLVKLPPSPRPPSVSLFSLRSRTLLLSFAPTKSPHPLSSKAPIFTRFAIRCHSTHLDSVADIDMVRTKTGVYAPKPNKVVILWDLDNKPPRGPPYQAAMALKQVAERFGEVVDMSAFANRHAFLHLPNWVIEERRERRNLDFLERKGIVTPSEPYVCGVCGRKCETNSELKKHFRQLHERERQKKLNRMYQLKGKKRQRFRERHIGNNDKYEEAARVLVTPKVGHGLEKELRRAGVFVKTVEDKPQAADWALKRQMIHSMSRGIDWLLLVSDDSDFSAVLRKVRQANLGTVVVGDSDRALGRHADFWVPWIEVEKGGVSDEDLNFMADRQRRGDDQDHEFFNGEDELCSFSDGSSGFDLAVDEILTMSSGFNGVRVSDFSEHEE
ncbi:hypothetical protein Dimus_028008 [Dionaea muscipula]